ncbi:unnamed protein product [Schistosoma rodhaini]|uniref:Uncharacterized protein n=1 Tax=Schistosoma rodhaini TaxID=6188 RepID=A0AA85FMM6_9TREM|nr:unnamed protein product [Schistosoma rodhaini]
MVCLVSFHVAALLLLLHTSTQTDVQSKQLDELKAKISRTSDKIRKSDPNAMKKIDEYIKCKTEYYAADGAIKSWSSNINVSHTVV